MNYFEYITSWVVLSLSPQMMWNKKFREKRKYILNQIINGRGFLDE